MIELRIRWLGLPGAKLSINNKGGKKNQLLRYYEFYQNMTLKSLHTTVPTSWYLEDMHSQFEMQRD